MAAELFGPSDVPKTVGLSDLRSFDLTAEEGFLLSRIDGRTDVRGLLALVSWDREKTLALLESLLRKHLVNFDRPEILAAVTPQSQVFATEQATGPSPQAVQPLAPIDRSSLEVVPDLDEERAVEVLEWEQRVTSALTLYALFGIPDGADVRSVKREYRQLAMKFHPDKFFRKEIGGYRARIEECWKRVQEAYERLTDPDQKAAYDAEILSRHPSRPAAGAPVSPSRAASPNGAPSPIAPRRAVPPPPPPPPPPSDAPAAEKSGSGPAKLPEVPEVEPRPRMESALERRIRQEVRERIEKAARHFGQAKQDFEDKKYVSADSNLKLALQLDPNNEDYRRWQASVKAVLEENIVAQMLRKGEMALLANDGREALDAYEHALSLFPENIAVNKAIGLLLLSRGENVKRAKECLQKVVAARPRDLDATIALVTALRQMGMVKNAQRVLEAAKELDPKDLRVQEEAKELKKAAK